MQCAEPSVPCLICAGLSDASNGASLGEADNVPAVGILQNQEAADAESEDWTSAHLSLVVVGASGIL